MTTVRSGCIIVLATGLLQISASVYAAEKHVGYQGTERISTGQQSSVYVEPVMLTEVYQAITQDLNVGAVVSNRTFGAGLQKAADIWGLNLDLFVLEDAQSRANMVRYLLGSLESTVIVDTIDGDNWPALKEQIQAHKVNFVVYDVKSQGQDKSFKLGFDTLRAARAKILSRIPKYDQVLPIAFPISPLPDSFFQATKFPYPAPVTRAERTSEGKSATSHAHVSCNMVAQTGNMLHRTSSVDPDVFLMGMEGGNLSIKALPGAVDAEKVSAVMTSWVLAIRDQGRGLDREVLVENDGVGSSLFKVGIHAPEELDVALESWRASGVIKSFSRLGHERVLLKSWDGSDHILTAGMFLIATDRKLESPELIPGRDIFGRRTIDFYSTQNFIQQLVDISEPATNSTGSPGGHQLAGTLLASTTATPFGGPITRGGGTTGILHHKLGQLLQRVEQSQVEFQPYVLSVEGGFLVVTPEDALSDSVLEQRVERLDLDLRGPLTSDQTITFTLESGKELVFRRTVLNFLELDDALNTLKAQALIGGWEYDGSRGRGLNANVVLKQFMGKHRKFMSSLHTWPSDEKPVHPVVRFYVDGMQRLNFTFISTSGWRQEFVEVPLRVPPVPRDVELYSDVSSLD
jgi:hypothetical protein